MSYKQPEDTEIKQIGADHVGETVRDYSSVGRPNDTSAFLILRSPGEIPALDGAHCN